MARNIEVSSCREFLIYWAGLFVAAFSIVIVVGSVLSLFAMLFTSYPCPWPVMQATAEPTDASETPSLAVPWSCWYPGPNPLMIAGQLTNLFGGIVFLFVGMYMMMSGRRR